MKRPAILFVIMAVAPALLVGCGGNNPPPAPVVDKPGNGGSGGVVPVKDETPALAGKAPTGSILQLLKGLPADKLPKPGPEGLIERNEAKAWLATNVVGKSLEFSLRVGAVELEDASAGKYHVELLFMTNPESDETQKLQANVKIGRIAVGKVPCEVQVWGPSPLWSDLDSATAKKRRELKGKQVALQARVTEAEFLEGGDTKQLLLMIGLADVTALRAEEPPWVKVSMPEGTCSALFPAAPTRFVHDAAGQEGAEYRWDNRTDTLSYGVRLFHSTAEKRRQADQEGDAAYHLKAGRDRAVGLFSEKLLTERAITLGGCPGLDFQFQTVKPRGFTVRQRAFYIDKRFFVTTVGSTNPEDVTSPDAERFFKSFTLESAK